MKRVLATAVLGALISTAAGCGSGSPAHRAVAHSPGWKVLHAGFLRPAPHPSPSDAVAKREVKINLREWKASLASSKPPERQTGLSRDEFRRRLAAAAARYDFSVKSLEFIPERFLAPVVVVQTRHYAALAGAIQSFMPRLVGAHPCSRGPVTLSCTSVDLFFEAQDEHGVPFIALGNGQWARSEALYPYVHA
jgi:hypothetical protein